MEQLAAQPFAYVVYEMTEEILREGAKAPHQKGKLHKVAVVVSWLVILVICLVLLIMNAKFGTFTLGLAVGAAMTLVIGMGMLGLVFRRLTTGVLDGLPHRMWNIWLYPNGVTWSSPVSQSTAPWSSFARMVKTERLVVLVLIGKGGPFLILPKSQLSAEAVAMLDQLVRQV